MRRLRVATAMTALTALLAAAGCGGSGGETTSSNAPTASGPTPNSNLSAGYGGVKRQAVMAAQSYVEAFSHGDQKTVCGLTQTGSAAIAKCRTALGGLNPSRQPKYRVVYVKVIGNQAKVLLKPVSDFGETTLFELNRVDGEWKAANVSVPVGAGS